MAIILTSGSKKFVVNTPPGTRETQVLHSPAGMTGKVQGEEPTVQADSYAGSVSRGVIHSRDKHRPVAAKVVHEFMASLCVRSERDLMSRLQALTRAVDVAATVRIAPDVDKADATRQAVVRASMRQAYGPLGDMFFGASIEDIMAQQEQARTQAAMVHEFRTELAEKDGVGELQDLEKKWSGERLPAQCRNEHMKAIMKQAHGGSTRAWEAAVDFWQRSTARNPEYRHDEIGRELYIVCLNKCGRISQSILEAQRHVRELLAADGVSPDMVINAATVGQAPRLNGEVLAGLGKAFHLVHEQAERGEAVDEPTRRLLAAEAGVEIHSLKSNQDIAKAAMDVSTRYYEAGFAADFEFYPGLATVYNLLEGGDSARALRMAPLVWSACQQAGGREAKDYWCLSTQVELSVIMDRPEHFAALFPRMLSKANVAWEVHSTLDKMKMLRGRRAEAGQDTAMLDFAMDVLGARVRQLEDNDRRIKVARRSGQDAVAQQEQLQKQSHTTWLADVQNQMVEKFGPAFATRPLTPAEEQKQRVTDAILANSGDFRAMTLSHAVGGNVPWGGQIPDLIVTRSTVRVVRQLLKEWGMDKEMDFNAWDRQVNARIGSMLHLETEDGTRPNEQLHGPTHKIIDGFDSNRFKLAATEQSKDTRTDLLGIMAIGIGDCRPTAYVKQLLFDVWQHDVRNNLMRQAMDASLTGRTREAEGKLDHVEQLSRRQLRVMSSTIHAPIQMIEKYQWDADPRTGLPLPSKDGTFNPVEDHTFNVLVEFDKNGFIKDELKTADGFYHQLYPLANLRLRASGILDPAGFTAGVMGIRDSLGHAIRFRLPPTVFSGNVLKEFEVGSSDFRFCGQTTAPVTLATILHESNRLHQLGKSIAEVSLPDAGKS